MNRQLLLQVISQSNLQETTKSFLSAVIKSYRRGSNPHESARMSTGRLQDDLFSGDYEDDDLLEMHYDVRRPRPLPEGVEHWTDLPEDQQELIDEHAAYEDARSAAMDMLDKDREYYTYNDE